MASEDHNRGAYLIQEHYCTVMAAPITARVCRGLADALTRETRTGARALDWPGEPTADALPLRTVGGLHALHRAGASPELSRVFTGAETEPQQVARIIGATLIEHDEALYPWLDGPPQTNEAGRSAALMTGLIDVARQYGHPLEILEIGSSAGLNLLIDRYRYDLGGATFGPADSPVTIRPEWRGAAPDPADLRFAAIRGVDIQPIDATVPENARRLTAYAWADTPERIARIEAGAAMLAERPVDLVAGDAADWVEARLAEPQADSTTRVLMHSVVWQYLGAERQARIRAAMHAAGECATRDRPLAWVRMEPNTQSAMQEVWAQSWPDAPAPRRFAQTHAHGTWVMPLDPAETPARGDYVAGGDGYWTKAESTTRS